jgi:transcriptional regulator with XRE-family HTH domain
MGAIVNEWSKELAKSVREVRDLLGWSQDKLARHARTSQGAISRLESGDCNNTPFTTVVKVCKVLALQAKSLDVPLTPSTAHLLDFAGDFTGEMIEPPDPALVSLIAAFHSVQPRHYDAFMNFFQATASLLTHLKSEYVPPLEPSRNLPEHSCADSCPVHGVS